MLTWSEERRSVTAPTRNLRELGRLAKTPSSTHAVGERPSSPASVPRPCPAVYYSWSADMLLLTHVARPGLISHADDWMVAPRVPRRADRGRSAARDGRHVPPRHGACGSDEHAPADAAAGGAAALWSGEPGPPRTPSLPRRRVGGSTPPYRLWVPASPWCLDRCILVMSSTGSSGWKGTHGGANRSCRLRCAGPGGGPTPVRHHGAACSADV
jgi:hypothetical protein